jgi:hypothetical protein
VLTSAPLFIPSAEFCCNGTVVDDPELGQVRTGLHAAFPGQEASFFFRKVPDLSQLVIAFDIRMLHLFLTLSCLPLSVCMQVIQLQGDQRKNVLQFLTQEGLVKKDLIKIHGF